MGKATLIRQEHIKKPKHSHSHKEKIKNTKRNQERRELLSQFIPSSTSPTVFTSLFSVLPLLPCKEFHQYYLSRFHTYVLIMIFVFLFLTYFALCNGFQLHPLIKSLTMVSSGKVENKQDEEQSKQKFHFIQTVLTFSLFFIKL